MEILLWCLAVVLILTGIAGTVLPAVPGVPLVFIGLLIGAWVDGFQKVQSLTLIFLAVLTALSMGVDVAAAALGAKRVQASRQALIGAVIGATFGIFAGVGGLIAGPFLGAAAGEFLARRDLIRAGEVGVATWIGMVVGVAAKFALCFAMVGIFITAYFVN